MFKEPLHFSMLKEFGLKKPKAPLFHSNSGQQQREQAQNTGDYLQVPLAQARARAVSIWHFFWFDVLQLDQKKSKAINAGLWRTGVNLLITITLKEQLSIYMQCTNQKLPKRCSLWKHRRLRDPSWSTLLGM